MTLLEKNFRELETMTEEVAYRFFLAKKIIQCIKNNDLVKENDSAYKAYLLKVETAYQALDVRGRNLINNEFFFQNYQNWWIGLYSKTNFYRLKKRTMLQFLEGIYDA